MSNFGKEFELAVETSCKEQNIFYFRVRDVNPMAIKPNFKLPQNKYDSLLYYKDHLFPIEMKSTKGKSFSFSESIIKQHQIDNLVDAVKYDGVIAGFLFNFRESENQTYFVHINDFMKYKHIAENQLEHTYQNKINKSSIPLAICKEIGIEVRNVKKVRKYRYYLNKLFDELIEKYQEYDKPTYT
jgi:penicillin-binding protein-related factor A (putative recombinase)